MSANKPKQLQVAKIGKTVGLHGEMKLHLKCDFPEQFKPGARFDSKRGELEIVSYSAERDLVKFKGYETPEEAKRLTNLDLFTSEEKTRQEIELEEGQYFWFDIVGADVYEGELCLGKVSEIERLGATDYLKITTHQDLIAREMPNSFLIPYLDNFVLDVDTQAKRIMVQGGFDILEAS